VPMSKPSLVLTKNNKLSSSKLLAELRGLQNKDQAKNLARFFKTGPGQYGAGDQFLGIMVPSSRQIAKKYVGLSLLEVIKVLHSPIHECRLVALLILVEKYQAASEIDKGKIVNLYLANTKWINNWDLVDLTAPKIVGNYYTNHPRRLIHVLSKSADLWERRIAVLSCFPWIKTGDFKDVFIIADRLLIDQHDLMHKAVGWMLREVGKVDLKILQTWLWPRRNKLPRTMLRYAIEKFPEGVRQKYLKS